jgi:YVTN family beta-propeller protein
MGLEWLGAGPALSHSHLQVAAPVASVVFAGQTDLFDAALCGGNVYLVGYRSNSAAFLYGVAAATRQKLGRPIRAAEDIAILTLPTQSDPKTIVLSPDCQTAYVAGYNSDRIYLVDLADLARARITKTIDLSPDVARELQPVRRPIDMALAASGRLYVVNSKEGADSVSVVDPSAGEVLTEIRVGRHPTSIALFTRPRSAHERAFVTNKLDGTVSVINLNTNTVLTDVRAEGPSLVAAGLEETPLSLFYAYFVDAFTVPPLVNRLNITTYQVDARIGVCGAPQGLAMRRTGLVVTCAGTTGPDAPSGYALVTDTFGGLLSTLWQSEALLGHTLVVIEAGARAELWANDLSASGTIQIYDLTK